MSNKIEGRVKSYFDKVFKSTTVQKFREDGLLHFSSFPFCPLKKLYSYLIDGIYLSQNMPFSMRYYTGVGTIVHEIMQEYAGQRGSIIGDYVCQNKECGVVNLYTKNPVCPECGTMCKYEELDVKYGTQVVGHTDGVFEYLPGRYIVIDYKTSSIEKVVKQNTYGNVYPTLANVNQIKMYGAALEEERGITIDGWALIYLARDNPMNNYAVVASSMSDKTKEVLKKRLKKYNYQYKIMKKVEHVNDEYMRKLVSTKPCKTEEDYMTKMYDGYNHCPLREVCFNNKKLKKEFVVAFRNKNIELPLSEAFKKVL